MSCQTEYRDRPGLLDLGLNASKATGFYQLSSRRSTTDTLLAEYAIFEETRFAILNLKGALLYYEHKYEEAKEIFEKVYTESGNTNLNACSNLEYINRKLGYWTEADNVRKNLKELYGEDGKRQKQQRLGEQAFAIMFDCHVSVQEDKRFERAVNLFDKCLHSAESETAIQQQWKLWYAESQLRLFGSSKDTSVKEECVREIISSMRTVLKSEYHILKSMAYTCMGQIMYKAKDFRHVIEQEAQGEEKRWLDDPEECFLGAVALHVSSEVVTRYALYLQGKRDLKHLQKAVNVLEKVNEEEVEENWFLRGVKCRTHLNLARKLEEHEKSCINTTNQTTSSEENNSGNAAMSDSSHSTDVVDDQHDGLTQKRNIENDSISRSQSTPEPADTNFDGSTEADEQSLNMDGEICEEKENEQNVHKTEAASFTIADCIEKAIMNGEQAIKRNPTVDAFHDVGCAYHMKARTEKDETKRQKIYFQSLSYFLNALNHLDGTKKPYVHVSQGQCLMEMKQYRPAIECYKRAIAVRTRNGEIYHFLFKGFIGLLCEMWNKGNRKEIIKEMIYWLQYAKANKAKEGILDTLIDGKDADVGSVSRRHVVAEVIGTMVSQDDSIEDVQYHLTTECLKQQNASSVQMALEVLGALIRVNCVDQQYSDEILKFIDEESMNSLSEDKQKKLVEMLQQSFCHGRENCHEKVDFTVLNAFYKVYRSCPFLADKVISEMKSNQSCSIHAKLPDILLNHIKATDIADFESKEESPIWASEASACIQKQSGLSCKSCQCSIELQRKVFKLERDRFKRQMSQQVTCPKPEPRVRQTEFDYDFYVIHSNSEKDRKWVLYELLPTLENGYRFKGCTDERDVTPGMAKVTGMNELCTKSFKILVILSYDYVQDPFCKFALQNALFEKVGQERVIPVLKDMVESPPELKSIMFMSAINNFDWEKLVKALEAD